MSGIYEKDQMIGMMLLSIHEFGKDRYFGGSDNYMEFKFYETHKMKHY